MEGYASRQIARAMRSVQRGIPRAEADPSRPIYHFRPLARWMNDPNGTIFHNGYYHIFYQHNPYGDKGGHMHWGHARSKNLVHWEHLPIALWPSKEMGEEHCFSGCAVMNGKDQPMIFYTSIGSEKRPKNSPEQWAALGDDDLMVWKKHPANPILTNEVHGNIKVDQWRDPFIFREQERTFMVIGGKLDQMEGGHAIVNLYEAKNEELTCWVYRGVLFRHPNKKLDSLECPNFFKLNDKWVLLISSSDSVEYFIGTIDLEAFTFRPESQGVVDHGTNFYATNVLFDDRGRCVLFGWVHGFKKGRGWNGCLSLPRILSVSSNGRLVQESVSELQKLRGAHYSASGILLTNTSYVLGDVMGNTLEILVEFEPADAKTFGLRMCCRGDSNDVIIACNGNLLDVAGTSVPFSFPDREQTIKLHIFVDISVLEVYVDDCECITRVIDPGADDLSVELFASEGSIRVRTLDVWKMGSIWS